MLFVNYGSISTAVFFTAVASYGRGALWSWLDNLLVLTANNMEIALSPALYNVGMPCCTIAAIDMRAVEWICGWMR